MSDDNVASLGFEVNSKPLDDATQKLGDVSAQAAKTGKSVDDLNAKFVGLGSAANGGTFQKVADQVSKVGDAFGSAAKTTDFWSGKMATAAQAATAYAGPIAAVEAAVRRLNDAGANTTVAEYTAKVKGATAATVEASVAANAAAAALGGGGGGGGGGVAGAAEKAAAAAGGMAIGFGGAALGVVALAVAAAGAVLSLTKVGDEIERQKREFAALTGSQADGVKAFNAVNAAAKAGGLDFDVVAAAASNAALGFDKLTDKHIRYANEGARDAKLFDDFTAGLGKLGAAMLSNGATAETEAKVLNTFGQSVSSAGTLTADSYRKIRGESQLAARELAEAFGYKGSSAIKDFQKSLEDTPPTIDAVNAALNRVKESETPINTVDKAVRDLKAAWKDFEDTLSQTGITDLARDALKGLSDVLKTIDVSGVIKSIQSFVDNEKTSLQEMVRDFKNLGATISGFVGGVVADFGKIVDAAIAAAKAVAGAVAAIASAVANATKNPGNVPASGNPMGDNGGISSDIHLGPASDTSSGSSSSSGGGSSGGNQIDVPAIGNPMGDFGGGGSSDSFDFAQAVADGTLPAFADGGQLTVTGSGGTDSQLVQFAATPGEVVTVSTPQDAAAATSSQSDGIQGLTTIQGQPAGAVGVVSATPTDATLATVKEITDAIDKSTIDITKNNLGGTDKIVLAINKLTAAATAPVTNPATGLPLSLTTGSVSSFGTPMPATSGGGGGGITGFKNSATDIAYAKAVQEAQKATNAAGGSPYDPMYSPGTGSPVGGVTASRQQVNRINAGVAPSGKYASTNPFYSAGSSGYGGNISTGYDYGSLYDPYAYNTGYASIGSSGDGSDPFVSGTTPYNSYDGYGGGGYDNSGSLGVPGTGSSVGQVADQYMSSGGSSYTSSSGFGDYSGPSSGFDPNQNSYGGGSVDAGYFATGGTFKVPGSSGSGIDKTLVTLHATPGETIMVAPNGATPPNGVTMPTLPSQASPTAVAALASAPSNSITNKTINILVRDGIQAASFIRSRAQIARGM